MEYVFKLFEFNVYNDRCIDTDSDEEALLLARKPNYMLIPSIQELEDYWREEIKKRNESI